MALTKKDQEMIAQIAAQAAITAVQAMGAATAAPVAQEQPTEELPDDTKEDEEARRVVEENERRAKQIEATLEEIIPHLMQERHLIVYRWSAQVRGTSLGGLLRQIVRAHVATETPNWREFSGSGGGSSRNLEALSERLPVHK